jgi:hypothetical protein
MNEEEFKRLLPERLKDFHEYLEIKTRLLGMKIDTVDPFATDEIMPKIVWKFEVYIQCNLRRSLDCLDLMELSWENKKSLGSYIFGRALLENTAQLFDLYNQTDRLLKERNFKGLNDLIENRLFGSKLEIYQDTPAVNIVGLVKKLAEKAKGFNEHYNQLCEVAHPNYFGMMGQYCDIDYEEKTANFDIGKTMSSDSLGRVFYTMLPSLTLYEGYMNLLIEKLPEISTFNAEVVAASKVE